MDSLSVVAIVPSAGLGTRVGGRVKKPYLPIGEKPLLVHTLSQLEGSPFIGHIILVVSPDDLSYCKGSLVREYGLHKVDRVVAGGRERQDSVWRGLRRARPSETVIMVHDGARPFVTQKLIEKSVKSAVKWGAAIAAVPVTDTVKEVTSRREVVRTVDRRTLWLVQTPQTFRADILKEAYRAARRDGYVGTDDACLVERLGIKVKVIAGSYDNLKITTAADLAIAQAVVGKGKAGGPL
jgi:2-C-methyl-D-erythritol 4-phosphate cytidylyltransferase